MKSLWIARNPRACALLVASFAIFAIAGIIVSCGGSSSNTMGPGMGTINVSFSDPPSCMPPNGQFVHVYLTVRSVQAHIDPNATDGSSGWQELAPQLASQPMQIDLFSKPQTTCVLAQLGSASLPVGSYQQIRLLLVSNSPAAGSALPANNACAGNGFNCVVLGDTTIHELQLSSQDNTGLKIPPGQIVGGPINVTAGQSVDLNIDFNACASIVQEGNGQFRLKPVLTAGQVSTKSSGISGQVVDASTMASIAGGTVIVALEQPGGSNADVIFMQTAADSAGNFNFCPLPMAGVFDVVVVAINGAGVAYNATVATGVPGGTNLGAIPLIAETGLSAGPATLQGFITATTGSAVASIDASVSALQAVTPGGGGTRTVTIPAEGNSVSNISVDSNSDCPATAPLNANCEQYTLIEPASNLSVGTFSSGKITYAAPAPGNVLYSVMRVRSCQ